MLVRCIICAMLLNGANPDTRVVVVVHGLGLIRIESAVLNIVGRMGRHRNERYGIKL
jgi:molybdopterin synthase catalytic subunit